MATPDYIVSLSEQAFFTLVAAALEAFEIRHADIASRPDADHEPLETYGNLWGYEARTQRNERIFHVSLADVDTSAERRPGELAPQHEAFLLKQDLVDWLRPELEYLGDFHTHPYDDVHDSVKSRGDLERQKLYEFSPQDFDYVQSLDPAKKKRYRVGMVVTVFKGDGKHRTSSRYIDDENGSCIRFSYKTFTIWLQCYVFVKKTAVADAKVALLCPAIGFHAASIG